MSSVREHDRLSISFTGKLDNGAVFAEHSPAKPLQVQLGESELPPTVEMAIVGMKKGESKKIRVSPDEGYGPRIKALLHEVPLASFGERIAPKPGMVLSQTITREGTEHTVPVTVIEIKGDKVVLDYNHPLAGHHLTYELTVVDID